MRNKYYQCRIKVMRGP